MNVLCTSTSGCKFHTFSCFFFLYFVVDVVGAPLLLSFHDEATYAFVFTCCSGLKFHRKTTKYFIAQKLFLIKPNILSPSGSIVPVFLLFFFHNNIIIIIIYRICFLRGLQHFPRRTQISKVFFTSKIETHRDLSFQQNKIQLKIYFTRHQIYSLLNLIMR